MAEKRDYYEVLGLTKSASEEDIKQAYRKAALKWHPDRWVNGTDAEKKTADEKFKEASEAYGVLSDKDKKARYDQFGFAGVNGAPGAGGFSGGGFDFSNLNDILENIFGKGFNFGDGFGRSQTRTRTYRGRDIRTRVSLTLEEIANGCEKELTLERMRRCPDCSGRGAVDPSDVKTCPTCNGNGQVQHVSNSIFGRSISYSTCPNCQGTGTVVVKPCRKCNGSGLVRIRETIKVKIPAGVEAGMQLTMKGDGHSPAQQGINGDLLIVIEEREHAKIKREGNNLFYTHVISIADAVLGCEVSIPCLDGPYKLKLSAGTQSGYVEKLRGKGLPSVNGYGKGDFYVKILVWIPRKLDKKTKQFFEELQNSKEVTPDPNREDKALFEKESKYF